MKNFTLVNPVIKGSLNTTFEAKTPNEAAMNAYKNISAYFAKNVPKFSFSMQEGETLYHFTAKEKINENGKIRFSIQQNKDIKDVAKLTKFIDDVDNLNGGGRYRYSDDSSESSSESSDYKYYKPIRRHRPIDYWYYYPNSYTYDYYYVPQFIPSVTPYVYVKLSP